MKFSQVFILAFALSPLVASANVSPVRVISTKTDIFYFKVDKSFIGAVIEVFSADGALLITDTVSHHKAIIDFYFERAGKYSIKMTKNDREENFTFEKTVENSIVALQNNSGEGSVSIIQ
ncbi:MAG: hypothetical protein ABIS36_13380 [Chryseolinea sp.]